MKTKKQIIKNLDTPTIPSNFESIESYAVKKIAVIFVGICILGIIIMSFTLIHNKNQKIIQQPPVAKPPEIPILTLKNQTYLIIDGVRILNLPKKEWTNLTNAFPHNLKTETINFYK